MARLTRQVGIRSAEVRLPGPSSAGPAIIKTALNFADRQFVKQADIRTQEAHIAARDMNLERDGDGNLMPPSLPIAENGLIAPSIYDREYTKMVSNRYMKQMEIDTKERLNLIATENRFDPQAYQALAEGYVNKVTELAPDILKPDVNMTAQTVMVEHYNRIIRETAERDHKEATNVQLMSIDRGKNELYGMIRGGASPEKVGAQVLKIRAAIEEGRDIRDGGLSFFDDAFIDEMHQGVDKDIVMAQLLATVQKIPDDELTHAEVMKALDEFSRGEGTVPTIDEFGNPYEKDVLEVFPNPDDRAVIANGVMSVLANKQAAFGNLKDRRLERTSEVFENWFDPHYFDVLTKGVPLDKPRLYEEFIKADYDVQVYGYDDTLRNRILGILQSNLDTGGTMSKWRQRFLPGFEDWNRRYQESMTAQMGGKKREDFTNEELRQMNDKALNKVGYVPGGYEQTVDGAVEIKDFYGAMTGTDFTQKYYEDMITDPAHPGWNNLEFQIPGQMAYIGIWSKELSDAIIGKLMSPEGMNREVLDQTLRLARMHWDQPSFRANMQDANALGRIGEMLDYHFRGNGVLTADNLNEELNKLNDSNFSYYQRWDNLDGDTKNGFRQTAQGYIESALENNWYKAHGVEADFLEKTPRQRQGPLGGAVGSVLFNVLKPQITNLDSIYMDMVEEKLKLDIGKFDSKNPDTFGPYIAKAVNEVMAEQGLAPTQIGFSPSRMNPYYQSRAWPVWDWLKSAQRPIWAVVQRPPEFYAIDPETGAVDRELIEYVTEDFQKELDAYSKSRFPDGERRFVAGVNAGLRYSGIDSAPNREGIPVWQIVLLDDDFITEETVFELDGPTRGNPYLFEMETSRKRYNDAKEAERRAAEERAEGLRLYYQSDQYQLDLMRDGM